MAGQQRDNLANPRAAWSVLVVMLLGFAAALSGALTGDGQAGLIFTIVTGALVLASGGYVVHAHVLEAKRDRRDVEEDD